jgi:hypothetical protein
LSKSGDGPKSVTQSFRNTKGPAAVAAGLKKNSGGVLLSHTEIRAVPSALRGLTTEFGMGSGMTLSPWPPEELWCSFAEEPPEPLISNQPTSSLFPQEQKLELGVDCEVNDFWTSADAVGKDEWSSLTAH